MQHVKRSDFLKRGATTLAALSAAGVVFARKGPKKADAANDRIVMAAVGLGGRGRDHARMFAQRDDVWMKYVCDADLNRIGNFPDQFERMQKQPVTAVQDLRRILEDADVDAVCVATSDHWHGPATVWACQAGKDVYVEKPASHNIWEGRVMVDAARKYGRVVQVGTQNRSAPYIHAAREYIAAGKLGDIPLIKVYNLKPGGPFRCPPDSDVPEGVDYDLYLGPAPMRPFNRGHFHDGWKKWWAYSGGDMADDGSHQLDIACMLLGDPAPPAAVYGSGGKYAYPISDGDVPDTQTVVFEYPGFTMTFELTQYTPYMTKTSGEVRDTDAFPYWPTNATRIELYGTRGLMYVGRHGGGWQVLVPGDKIRDEMPGRQHTPEHHQNFIDRIRDRGKPNADIEIGHKSAILIHLANIATALNGRRLLFDPETEEVTNDAEANGHILRKRIYREGYDIAGIV